MYCFLAYKELKGCVFPSVERKRDTYLQFWVIINLREKKKKKKKNSTWCSPSHRSPRENTIIFLDSARRHLSFWLSTYLSDWKYWKLIKHLKRCFILAPLILNIEIWQLKDSNWSKQDSWSRTLEFWTELLS